MGTRIRRGQVMLLGNKLQEWQTSALLRMQKRNWNKFKIVHFNREQWLKSITITIYISK